MHNKLSIVALLAVLAFPATVLAANTIDPSLIPDGTYTVRVDQLLDNKHIKVTMNNGAETTLSAGRDTVDFGKIKAGDQVKLSLIKGEVMVYLDLTTH